jgi:hypothetical protein
MREISNVLVVLICTAIPLWMAVQIIKGTWQMAWFAVGLLSYLMIWLLMPRTWRDMHRERQ